jgi:hypothetical protein
MTVTVMLKMTVMSKMKTTTGVRAPKKKRKKRQPTTEVGGV